MNGEQKKGGILTLINENRVFLFKMFLIHIAVSLFVMRTDPTFHHYFQKDFASCTGILLLLLGLPLYWIFGLLVVMLFPPLLVSSFPWNVVSLLLLIATYLKCRGVQDKKLRMKYYLITLSIILNAGAIIGFCYAQSA
ncbi:MAG: hypothetical protein HQK52_17955 [Oligoflexia bacterium]|nr:hypothetical protein [Oligoflexia bacterium]